MCGIAGFVGPFDERALRAMTELMHHRGPDDTGYTFLPYAAGPSAVGLGHKRLSIIDLSTGHQPLWNAEQSLGLVFNGEIYNYRELRRRLLDEGHTFRTQSDTEVILVGYAAWGADVVQHLEGMFAFAIWDVSRREWFLARDRFGIKPLYYSQPAPGSLALASEIKPLLTLGSGVSIHREAFYHYLLYGWSSTPETLFQGVYQLPPAHWLRWREGQIEKQRYWRLEKLAASTRSQEEWCESLRTGLSEAVVSHLVADVPVGITLSGGLDSSAVLSMMAQATDTDRLQAFTVGFGLPNDETPYARLAAERVGVKGTEHIEPIENIDRDFSRILWHLEEPLPHPVLGTTYYLARFVQQHLKVILVGEGSDEFFAGYPHYRLFDWPFRWAPRSTLRRYFLAAAYVMPNAKAWAGMLNPDWLDRGLLEHVAHAYDGYFQAGDDDGNNGDGGLRMEIENELTGNQLMRIDKLMMSHSVEARVPFLDRSFAQTAFSVPFPLKRRGGREKHILREAMRGQLPPEIVDRPKSGPRGTQALLPFLTGRVLGDRVRRAMSQESIRRRGWFRADAVDRYFAGRESFWVRQHPIDSRTRSKFALLLATLDEWARLFQDRSDFTARP